MEDIKIIGPIAVGKTTTAKLLSKRMNRPYISLDDLRIGYYKEIGYGSDHKNDQQKDAVKDLLSRYVKGSGNRP